MTTEEFLRRHLSRMGARLRVTEAGGRQWAKIRIDIGRDRSGEFFDIRCGAGVIPEVLDVLIDDLVQEGLVDVVATLKPVVTYKVRR